VTCCCRRQQKSWPSTSRYVVIFLQSIDCLSSVCKNYYVYLFNVVVMLCIGANGTANADDGPSASVVYFHP
jgi:hypothetical protein